MNILANSKIEKWWQPWHLLTFTGAAGVLLAGSLDTRFLLFLAFLLFGVGQWKNYTKIFTPVPGMVITSHVRKATRLGVCLEFLGIALFLTFLVRVYCVV